MNGKELYNIFKDFNNFISKTQGSQLLDKISLNSYISNELTIVASDSYILKLMKIKIKTNIKDNISINFDKKDLEPLLSLKEIETINEKNNDSESSILITDVIGNVVKIFAYKNEYVTYQPYIIDDFSNFTELKFNKEKIERVNKLFNKILKTEDAKAVRTLKFKIIKGSKKVKIYTNYTYDKWIKMEIECLEDVPKQSLELNIAPKVFEVLTDSISTPYFYYLQDNNKNGKSSISYLKEPDKYNILYLVGEIMFDDKIPENTFDSKEKETIYKNSTSNLYDIITCIGETHSFRETKKYKTLSFEMIGDDLKLLSFGEDFQVAMKFKNKKKYDNFSIRYNAFIGLVSAINLKNSDVEIIINSDNGKAKTLEFITQDYSVCIETEGNYDVRNNFKEFNPLIKPEKNNDKSKINTIELLEAIDFICSEKKEEYESMIFDNNNGKLLISKITDTSVIAYQTNCNFDKKIFTSSVPSKDSFKGLSNSKTDTYLWDDDYYLFLENDDFMMVFLKTKKAKPNTYYSITDRFKRIGKFIIPKNEFKNLQKKITTSDSTEVIIKDNILNIDDIIDIDINSKNNYSLKFKIAKNEDIKNFNKYLDLDMTCFINSHLDMNKISISFQDKKRFFMLG